MKATAIYMKFDANPFNVRPGDYKQITGLLPAGLSDELIASYAKDAVPEGYVFVGIERDGTGTDA
ncbi:hypothetical protein [Rikenella microfusus]|uniref:Uncharacterized protein n=1 Tax=Rikenella microfusus TaxID=28139 RepID=A0A379MPN9_9BACT|nr:hypothetical protein [Rikenella microfusus]SUE33694.1 Uncharacterised protein [Rikenella microfusus]HJE88606.1 hypothetical protein [Rikenella microfusus]